MAQVVTPGGLVRNDSAMIQQAGLAPWLRQASAQVTPMQHPNPPTAPWYAEGMQQRQTAQAEMVRAWKAEQEKKAKEAEAAVQAQAAAVQAQAAAAAAVQASANAQSAARPSGWVQARNQHDEDADRYGIPGIAGPGVISAARSVGLK